MRNMFLSDLFLSPIIVVSHWKIGTFFGFLPPMISATCSHSASAVARKQARPSEKITLSSSTLLLVQVLMASLVVPVHTIHLDVNKPTFLIQL